MTAAELLDRIVAWAAGEPNVRRLVLVGSRARTAATDDLADVDLQLYAMNCAAYAEDRQWLSRFEETWVCVQDRYVDGEVQVPTWLVIFGGGVKVDFALYPAGMLSTGVRSGLPHRVLVEKDSSTTPSLEEPASCRDRNRPGGREFRRVVEEFWFEAYHVAKYLSRNELWLAKARDWATKQFLLTMICWHEQFVHSRFAGPDCEGTRAAVSADTWQALQQSFGGFGREEGWDAAFQTMALFRRLGRETAAALGYCYPADVDRNLFEFISTLRNRRH